MSHKMFVLVTSLFLALALSFSVSTPVLAAPPANDNFANATAITSLPFITTVDNTNATTEPGEPQACGSSFGSVWYSFSPTENMALRVDTAGSTKLGIVNIYLASGPGFSDLTFVTCRPDRFDPGPTNFLAEAGKSYYLQVESDPGHSGVLQISLEQITPPANDNFANAEAIASLPFYVPVDNTDATTEPGEPQCFISPFRTVWYSFRPTENMLVRLDMTGSVGFGSVNVYVASGTAISDLTLLACVTASNPLNFDLEAGKTYYLQASGDEVAPGPLQINLNQILSPNNDDFANAEAIASLPFDSTVNNTLATLQADEPIPSCGIGATDRTVWYSFTPSTSGSISVSIPTAGFTPIFAAYTGDSLTGLIEIGCTFDGNMLTFHVDAGTTYYIQIGNLYPWEQGGSMQFHIEIAPQPVAGFSFFPLDPSVFDNIQFCDTSFDPGGVGIQAVTWDFGDGTTSSENCAFHQYGVDGDYTVQQLITTFDRRTASSFQVLHVSTHDLSISKIIAPRSAKVGKTRTITVSLKNIWYPESVLIELYRSVPGGWELIGSSIELVPVLQRNRTTQINFKYTFTPEDAQAGRVTFRAVVMLLNANDSIPANNESISSPPTRVRR